MSDTTKVRMYLNGKQLEQITTKEQALKMEQKLWKTFENGDLEELYYTIESEEGL